MLYWSKDDNKQELFLGNLKFGGKLDQINSVVGAFAQGLSTWLTQTPILYQ